MIGRQRASFYLVGVLLSLFMITWLVIFSPGASARLGLVKIETFIEIDGVNFGEINGIKSLRDLTPEDRKGEGFTKVTLKRDFVTERSLYLWAHKIADTRTSGAHISVVTQTKSGVNIARYELNNCKPLSWTVETADPSQGGFHEKVELAVQNISIK